MSAPENPLWLEYRLDRLTFQNGARVDFPSTTRMLYSPEAKAIAVETSAAKRQEVKSNLADAELRKIEYAMLVDLPAAGGKPAAKTVIPFYHPMRPGNGVRLTFNDRGEMFFRQQASLPLFSKQWTLRDVSGGKIDSDRAVWQFHGWRHEH